MVVQLMSYTVAASALLAAAALAGEFGATSVRLPRRWAWIAAIALSFAWPATAILASRPAAPVSFSIDSAPMEKPDIAPSASERPVTHNRGLPAPAEGESFDFDGILGYGWIVGWASVLIFYGAGAIKLRRMARMWEHAEVDGVAVSVSDRVGPAVVGMLRPRIVIPRWLADSPGETRTLALAHERSHIAARDPLLVMAAFLLISLAPWNPVLWWLLRRLRSAIEVDCDARVLGRGTSVSRYGEMLLAVGGSQTPMAIGSTALIERTSQLEKRVRVMTAGAMRHARLAFTAAMAALIGIGAVAAQLDAPRVDIGQLSMSDPQAADCARQIREAAESGNRAAVKPACWRLGPVALGMSRVDVERTLGPADYAAVKDAHETDAFYVFPRDLHDRLVRHPVTEVVHRDLEVTFVDDKIVRLDTAPPGVAWGPKCQLDKKIVRRGDDSSVSIPYDFATIKIGDSPDTVARRLGKFASCGVAAIDAEYKCSTLPMVFSVPEGDKVAGFAIAATMEDLHRGGLEHFFKVKDPKTCLYNGYKLLPKGPPGYEGATFSMQQPTDSQLCVERAENNGLVNVVDTSIWVDDKFATSVRSGKTTCFGISPGTHKVSVQSVNPYLSASVEAGSWKSKPVTIELHEGEKTTVRACQVSENAVSVGWAIKAAGEVCDR
jgi:beta-lactamase regulating signal transducer with metallopeptidase domain